MGGPSAIYLPARRCQRVAFSIFLCFFFRIRLRRFLISDPMSAGQGSRRLPAQATRLPWTVSSRGSSNWQDTGLWIQESAFDPLPPSAVRNR